MLKVEGVCVRYGERQVVKNISFQVEDGQWLMLAGPNGAGKSSLLTAISQGVNYEGRILLQDKDIRLYRPSQLARQVGVLAQNNHVGYAYTVEEVVNLGRYAHSRGFFSQKDDSGADRVEDALKQTGMTPLRRQIVTALSGGELQRTFLAQVFAQNPRLLLLDEPANHLDLIYQKHIFSLIQEWLRQPGRAVISVVHDLSLARKYGTHAVLMHEGQCVAQGETKEVLTGENLRAAYGMDVPGWMRELLGQWTEA